MMMTLPMVTPDKFHDECAVFGITGIRKHPISPISACMRSSTAVRKRRYRRQRRRAFPRTQGHGVGSRYFFSTGIESSARLHGHWAQSLLHRWRQRSEECPAVDGKLCARQLGAGTQWQSHQCDGVTERTQAYGAIFQSTSDTEVVIHLIAHSRADTLLARVMDALSQVRGAFSVVLMTDDGLIAARDPYGFRPLCLGGFGTPGWLLLKHVHLTCWARNMYEKSSRVN